MGDRAHSPQTGNLYATARQSAWLSSCPESATCYRVIGPSPSCRSPRRACRLDVREPVGGDVQRDEVAQRPGPCLELRVGEREAVAKSNQFSVTAMMPGLSTIWPAEPGSVRHYGRSSC